MDPPVIDVRDGRARLLARNERTGRHGPLGLGWARWVGLRPSMASGPNARPARRRADGPARCDRRYGPERRVGGRVLLRRRWLHESDHRTLGWSRLEPGERSADRRLSIIDVGGRDRIERRVGGRNEGLIGWKPQSHTHRALGRRCVDDRGQSPLHGFVGSVRAVRNGVNGRQRRWERRSRADTTIRW
ncbi:MAG: hypothetical protein QOE83_1087 [Actinomycetota bacterium]|nr:hypothetical protein [Actinomycetota bacterium]